MFRRQCFKAVREPRKERNGVWSKGEMLGKIFYHESERSHYSTENGDIEFFL